MAPVEMGSPSDLNLDAAQSGGQNLGQPHRSSKCPEWQVWVDAVEKVRGILLTRNNRIVGVDFLNRTCAFDAHFESILLRDPPKSFFDSIGQKRLWRPFDRRVCSTSNS